MILKTATKTYDLAERTHIMGILNVTPDSFSDGGNYTSLERAVKQAIEMEKQGADIIDIGGESTRPNHKAVSLDEELSRVIPMIKAVKSAINIPISVDTYKAEVAKQAIEAGADIDRKSTRLNSSHVAISYAVFCLKKKKKSKLYQT